MFRSSRSYFAMLVLLILGTNLVAQGPIKSVTAGDEFSAALDRDGLVFAWGANDKGQLGDGSTLDRLTPVIVPGINATSISCGASHMLALLTDGTVVAWGENSSGQLGDGTISALSASPVVVSGMTGIVAVSAGKNHSLALDSLGQVWAWGANSDGRLGDGTTVSSPTPIQVLGLGGVVAISAGNTHSLALLSDGSVRAWGANTTGQLGNGTTMASSTPVTVSSLSGIRSIAAGQASSVARDNNGLVWNWGRASGATASPTPSLVPGPTRVIAVHATHGGSRAALSSDGKIWLWEFSDTSPIFTMLGAAPVSLGAGGPHLSGHIINLMGNGNLVGIGGNSRGQLGDNTTTTPTPGTDVLVQGLGVAPGTFLVTPARQTLRPGETAQFDFIGPPLRFFSIFLDYGPGNTATPYGIFGLEDSPLLTTFDGIGVFPGSMPTFLQLGLDGRATIFGYPATQLDIGIDYWVQAVVFDPTLPEGFLLSQTEHGRGGGAANRISVSGLQAAAGEASFDRAGPTIHSRDLSFARGMISLPYSNESRTFFVDDSTNQGDVIRLEAAVNAGTSVPFNVNDHRVIFEANSIASVYDTDSQGPQMPGLSATQSAWFESPIGSGNWTAQVDIDPALSLATDTAVGVRVRLERLVAGVWTRIDSTRGEEPQFLNDVATPWSNHVVQLTSERHVVLVHGWGGSEESFGNLEMMLETAANPTKRRPTRNYRGDMVGAGIGGRVSITTQASELDDFLTNPTLGVDSAEPDFICHSMGGLSVRRWLADHPPTAPGGEMPSLVCLGTPHYGVPCFLIDLSGDPGERDMRRGSVFLRNLARDWRTISPQVRVLDVVGLGQTTGGSDGNGDFLVPGYSASMQANGSSSIIPDAQHTAYYLANTGHTGSATGFAFLCLSPSGIDYLVPMANESHASYRLIDQFVVDRSSNPNLVDKPSSPNLNRAAIWVERPKADSSAINMGGSTSGTYTNNDDPNFDCDVYFFNLSSIASLLVGWDLCPGGTGCFPAGTATLLPGGVYVTP